MQMRPSLYSAAALIAASAVFLLTGCGSTNEPLSVTDFKLNTMVGIQVYDNVEQSVLSDALALCDNYSKIFSRTDSESELYRLNAAAKQAPLQQYPVSDSLAAVLAEGLACAKQSGGAFDPTIEPVSSLWDFSGGDAALPDEAALRQSLLSVGYEAVSLTQAADGGWQLSTARSGMGFDLGAVAKGYIADRIKEFLLQNGVCHAVINLGGNVLCIGSKPDGSPFHIGVRQPFSKEQDSALVVEADGLSVVTAGIYERCFEQDGQLYHHILNPNTGYSYDNGIASVTIISALSMTGDSLSTTCFTLGPEQGLALVNETPGVEAALLMRDGSVRYSSGFSKYVLSE